MVRSSSSSSSSSAVTVAAIVALGICSLHAVVAYPALMERVPGDNNNFLPLRNSPSRDLDRFIGHCEDHECGGRLTAKRSSLDRLEPGHLVAGKRAGSDRPGHPVEATGPKRSPDRVRRLLQQHYGSWADLVRKFDSYDDDDDDDDYTNYNNYNYNHYFGGDDCVQGGCMSPAKLSSF